MEKGQQNYINSINLNTDADFPYLVLEVVNGHSYPLNPGFRVMHWHEDVQFIYVLEGTVHVQTLNNEVELQSSEGIFINRNVVHLVKQTNNCHYMSFVFPEYILKFYAGCPANSLVENLIGQECIPFCYFSKRQTWCEQILFIMQELTTLEKKKNEFYVCEVMIRLFTLVLLTRKNHVLSQVKPDDTIALRMRILLHYIEQHYGDDVTLESLAQSANVSKSECIRCFKLSMQITPYKYLMEYRLSRAALLLRQTNESVGNIASNVGFHQMSRFGKCFKEKTGCTPKEYRNAAKNN